MESKTKHRILGSLVVIALVVIFLPLFDTGTPSATSAAVEPPPFPDQSVQVSSSDSSVPIQSPTTSDDGPFRQQPDDVISDTHPNLISAKSKETKAKSSPHAVDINQSIYDSEKRAVDAPAPIAKPLVTNEELLNSFHPTEVKRTNIIVPANKRPPSNKMRSVQKPVTQPVAKIAAAIDPEIIKIKDAMWAVQIGTFSNKANALRMVNNLRANGYRAFIHEAKAPYNGKLRVMVGPLNKKDSAKVMAAKLENTMHLRGIIVNYKPLTV